jgi:cytidylate kinase
MGESHNYYKISISGDLGSGKSTISKLLREKLSFDLYSMGEAWRSLAAKYNMSILELNKYSETHPLDEEMDQAMAAKAGALQNIIFDSRLAWHFIPQSFKIHLTVDPMIAATRIFNDKRGDAEDYVDVTEAYQKINQRRISENNRYIHKYGIDCSQLNHYNLVVDTSHASPESIATLIIHKFDDWIKGRPFAGHWISPRTPFPTRNINEIDRKQIDLLTNSIATEGFKEIYPLSLVAMDGFYYIYDGHKRASAALLKENHLIPVAIIAEASDTLPSGEPTRNFISKMVSLPNIHHWEEFHQFRYPQYPAPKN